MRMKSIMVEIKVPIAITTAGSVTSPASLTTSGERTMLSSLRSTSPMIQPMKGMNTSFTSEVVIFPKAVAMITPTAISRTLPFAIKVLNSSINFFNVFKSFLFMNQCLLQVEGIKRISIGKISSLPVSIRSERKSFSIPPNIL